MPIQFEVRRIKEHQALSCFHLKVLSDWLLFFWIIVGLNVNFDMFCKRSLISVSLAALVALEWFLPSTLLLVALQMTRSSASVVALVAFERLFFCVLPPYMNFQFCSFNARILAACASVWLFIRVRLLVPLQRACFCCFVIALIAMM